MIPDQELRIAVAREMGWTNIRQRNKLWIGESPNETRTFQTAACLSDSKTLLQPSIVPAFDTDLNATATLIDKLAGMGWSYHAESIGNSHRFAFLRDDYERYVEEPALAESLPRAICLAFLAVMKRDGRSG